MGSHVVGKIREGCCSLIGGNDQVGIIFVVAYNPGRWDDGIATAIICHIEQAADERLVARAYFSAVLIGFEFGQSPRNKTAFGADRDNHSVLGNLCFDKPQDFGAKIFRAIGPAQATPGHFTATQVDCLDLG